MPRTVIASPAAPRSGYGIGLARLCFLLAGIIGCGHGARVTIGITVGPDECDAARLAYGDAVRAGLRMPIDTIFINAPDTRAEPAIRAAQQFVSIPRLIAVVGHNNSAASLAAAPIYNEHTVLLAAVQAGARNGRDVQKYLDALGRKRPAFHGIAGPVVFTADGDVVRGYVLTTVHRAL